MVHIFTFFSFSPIFCFSNIFVHIFTFVLLFFVFILIFTCCSKLLLCVWITCFFDFYISSFNFFENNFTCVLHIVSHVHICFCIFFMFLHLCFTFCILFPSKRTHHQKWNNRFNILTPYHSSLRPAGLSPGTSAQNGCMFNFLCTM